MNLFKKFKYEILHLLWTRSGDICDEQLCQNNCCEVFVISNSKDMYVMTYWESLTNNEHNFDQFEF